MLGKPRLQSRKAWQCGRLADYTTSALKLAGHMTFALRLAGYITSALLEQRKHEMQDLELQPPCPSPVTHFLY